MPSRWAKAAAVWDETDPGATEDFLSGGPEPRGFDLDALIRGPRSVMTERELDVIIDLATPSLQQALRDAENAYGTPLWYASGKFSGHQNSFCEAAFTRGYQAVRMMDGGLDGALCSVVAIDDVSLVTLVAEPAPHLIEDPDILYPLFHGSPDTDIPPGQIGLVRETAAHVYFSYEYAVASGYAGPAGRVYECAVRAPFVADLDDQQTFSELAVDALPEPPSQQDRIDDYARDITRRVRDYLLHGEQRL